MNFRKLFSAVYVLSALLGISLFVFTEPALAHGDEDHSSPTDISPTTGDGESVSISAFGETFDITFIYPAFSPGETIPLRIFVANLETNRPVSGAEIGLTLTGPGTDVAIVPLPVTDSAGEYTPGEYYAEAEVADNGDYSFLIEVSTDEDFDLFSVDGFTSTAAEMETTSGEAAFSIRDYDTYLFLAGYVLVAFLAYSLGTRERKGGGKKTETKKKAKVGEPA